MATQDEIRIVAQAITDAHARAPGLDCEGRIDDAKTVIAAVDALMAFRAAPPAKTPKSVAKAIAHPVAGADMEAEPVAPGVVTDLPVVGNDVPPPGNDVPEPVADTEPVAAAPAIEPTPVAPKAAKARRKK